MNKLSQHCDEYSAFSLVGFFLVVAGFAIAAIAG